MSDIVSPFTVTVEGRPFRITVTGGAVDCRDICTNYESQSIVGAAELASRDALLADPQTRDAIASAYYNATAHESGRFPVGGTPLPDGFAIITED